MSRRAHSWEACGRCRAEERGEIVEIEHPGGGVEWRRVGSNPPDTVVTPKGRTLFLGRGGRR